jgi:hypothetical protein
LLSLHPSSFILIHTGVLDSRAAARDNHAFLHISCNNMFPVNRPALLNRRQWVASVALAAYCVVALAGHGMHQLAICEHGPHEVHDGDGEPCITAAHGTTLHDSDHCIVCQFCAQAQLPIAESPSLSWQHTGERIAHDSLCRIVPVFFRAYSPRGPPLVLG